jgi:hypothetical protein
MKWKLFMPLFLFLFLSCEKNQDEHNSILKFYGSQYEDIGYSVALADNGYVISGQLTELVHYSDVDREVKKLGIIKTGSDGNQIWKMSFGGRLAGTGLKVIINDDASVVATGYVTDSVTLEKDIIVVKVNSDGTGVLEKIYKATGNQSGSDIIKTPEGFLVMGTTDVLRESLNDSTGNKEGKTDILLLRINNNLEQIVAPGVFGFPGNDAGAAIKKDINGGYIIVGTTDRSEPGQSGNNILLLKINADGSTKQSNIIGGTDDEYAADIEVLNDGYIIAVTVGAEGEDQWIYVSKISKNIFDVPPVPVKLPLQSTSSSIKSFSVKAISPYRSNSFVMTGQAGTGSSAKMLIFVTDPFGTLVTNKVLIAGSTGIQVGYDVVSEATDDIIAVGKNSYEKNTMISLLKFRF